VAAKDIIRRSYKVTCTCEHLNRHTPIRSDRLYGDLFFCATVTPPERPSIGHLSHQVLAYSKRFSAVERRPLTCARKNVSLSYPNTITTVHGPSTAKRPKL